MKSVLLSTRPGQHGLAAVLSEAEPPSPSRGELVVKMAACGLCGTDLEKMRGEYTASMPVIGHEAVGTVSEVGKGVRGLSARDRVFPHHHVPDYTCYICRSGNETMCDRYRKSNLDPGGFSEYFRVPSWNVARGGVLKLPRSMPFDVASMIEPLGCCIRSIGKCGVRKGDTVLVAGTGPVGMMHALLLKDAGAEVVVSDVSEARMRFAERMRVGGVLDATSDVPGQVISKTHGRGADVAIIASGNRAAIIQGLRSVRKGGKVCLFGVPPSGSVLDYDISELYNSERAMITSYGATEKETRAAIKVLESRGKEFAKLVTHRFPLHRFDEAVQAASEGSSMKVVVTP